MGSRSAALGRGAWVLAGLMLAGCGGGNDLVEPFRPARLLSFGDETSVLAADGSNWGVNGLDATTSAFDCKLNPNWVQYLASRYSFVFAQCNPDAVAVPQALMLAAPGAKVADALAQVQAQLAGGTIGPGDLVTILAGAHDILEQYALYTGSNEAALVAELQTRGQAIAQQVNALAAIDGRIIVSLVHDLGLTPFGIAENTANAGRAALLTRLTAAFNTRLRTTLTNNGRRIGLVRLDDEVVLLTRDPARFALANVTQAVCTVAPPACTTATLVAGGDARTWLWAHATHLSAGGQLRLGQLAETRAFNNPF